MKRFGIACIVTILFTITAQAQSGIDAEGVANAKTVLRFSGTRITARIESDFRVGGSLEIEGRPVSFTASGTAHGEGTGDSAALTLDVWIVIEAIGETAVGEPISIRGGISGSSEDTDLSGGTLGSASGPFFFVVALGADSFLTHGMAAASASGVFVVPDDPLTMQIEGIGTYSLVGDLVADASPSDAGATSSGYLGCLPWDPETWPEELLTELLRLIGGPLRAQDENTGGETAGD